MKETMAWLATNYKIGIGVATGVFVILYVVTGVLICLNARKRGMDVSIGAMIPVWRISYPIRLWLQKRKERRKELLAKMQAAREVSESTPQSTNA